MLLVAPPELQRGELSWVAASRYADIAEDVAAAVQEAPPLFGGPRGRERTAVLLPAVAWRESACTGPVVDMLRAYTSGSCDAGDEASRNRVLLAQRWYGMLPPPQ